MYVLEFTKEIPEENLPETPIAPRPARPSAVASSPEPVTPEWAKPVAIPAIDEIAPRADKETTFVEYEVQKGDTLQKISKKFYGSYAKWQMIVDANKETLPNPNRLRTGMKLKIPTEGATSVDNGEAPVLK